jgi:hypothetical protein
MEWWGWIAWAAALATGLAGTVLGIRSELRASAYKPRWVLSDRPMSAINRTGEDASSVEVSVVKGGRLLRPATSQLVVADEALKFQVVPDDPREVVSFAISWTRSHTGKKYRWPPARRGVLAALAKLVKRPGAIRPN